MRKQRVKSREGRQVMILKRREKKSRRRSRKKRGAGCKETAKNYVPDIVFSPCFF